MFILFSITRGLKFLSLNDTSIYEQFVLAFLGKTSNN